MSRRSLLLTEKPDTLKDDIAAIDYVLKLCGFNEDPQQFMPKLRKRGIFAKGEKRRLIMGELRKATEPLSSRDICLAILVGKDFDMSDKRRLNQTTVSVYNLLCRECQFGRVSRVVGFPARWMKLGDSQK